ncbi:MAG: UbiA family prenyltransferase [Halodesulfurarchaeum sp.]
MSSKTSSSTVDQELHPSGEWRVLPTLWKYAQTLKQIAVFTQLDLVVMGVAAMASVMWLLELPLSPAPAVIALVTFGVYVGDRISDVSDEPTATSARSEFMRRHRTLLSIGSALAYGLAIAIAAFGGPLALAITLIPGAAWIVYASDLFDGLGSSLSRLKRVVILNSTIVGVAWGIAIVFLPISFAGAAIGPIAVVLFAYFTLDIFVGTEIPNLRDIEDDAENGVKTLPLSFGITRTRHVIYTINVLIVGVLLYAFTTELLSLAFLGAALVGRAYAVVLHGFVGRTDRYRLLEFLGEMKHVLVAGVFALFLFS